jgi:hypothetical protein
MSMQEGVTGSMKPGSKKETEQYYREQLEERQNRLDILKRDGVKALSRYDIEIASGEMRSLL